MGKYFAGILFGIFIGGLINEGIGKGATFIFRSNFSEWGAAFWGEHYILRTFASLLGSGIGGLASGCFTKTKGEIWGLISSLPSLVFWIIIGALGLYVWFLENNNYQAFNKLKWVTIIMICFLTPIIGFYGGRLGSFIRRGYPNVFESDKNIVLGIKWYHWFWLSLAIYFILILGTISYYQGLFLILGTTDEYILFRINSILAFVLVGLSLGLLGLSIYKIFYLLMIESKRGVTKIKMMACLLGWAFLIPFIVVSFFHYLFAITLF